MKSPVVKNSCALLFLHYKESLLCFLILAAYNIRISFFSIALL